ncbi:MAG TPA: ribosome maturation factor RimP [Candidatus Eisenbacteria bacterium]|nr:ribosome maturation factor RimP [Candidatus Eisenbacteria bacterium]
MDRGQLREELTRRLQALLGEEMFDLWELELASQAGRTVVRIVLDRPTGVTIADCAYWNKKIGRYLEAENVVPDSYVLEVGSPGIERTLSRPEHFARFVGRSVTVKLHDLHLGRRTYRGELRQAGDDAILLEDPDAGVVSLPYAAIRHSHIIADPWEGLRAKERRPKG